MALSNDGTVIAWGRNNKGQTDCSGKLEEMGEIIAGFDFSIALNIDFVRWGNYATGGIFSPVWIKGCNWLGPIGIGGQPWLWSMSLNSWIYVPDESALSETGWIYTVCPMECTKVSGIGYIPWAWSNDLNTMVFIPEETWNTKSGWVYVF